jgi:hypothetical protein
MKLVNGALEIYNKFIVPVLSYLLEKFEPMWRKLWEDVSSLFGSVFGIITDVVTGLIETCSSLIDFTVGVFKGDWEKAWDGIVGAFTTIWETLKTAATGVVNLIIDALNSFIDGINKIHFDVPEWVPIIGGKNWGFDIPSIPHLAQGTVVPPNREFLAVLGDNKTEHEIVSPISTMKQAFAEALAEMGGSGSTTVVLEIDGREFGHAVIEQGQRESRRLGTRLVMA